MTPSCALVHICQAAPPGPSQRAGAFVWEQTLPAMLTRWPANSCVTFGLRVAACPSPPGTASVRRLRHLPVCQALGNPVDRSVCTAELGPWAHGEVGLVDWLGVGREVGYGTVADPYGAHSGPGIDEALSTAGCQNPEQTHEEADDTPHVVFSFVGPFCPSGVA